MKEQDGQLVFAPDRHFAGLTAPLGQVRLEPERAPDSTDGPLASAHLVVVRLTTRGRTVEVLLSGPDAECLRALLALGPADRGLTGPGRASVGGAVHRRRPGEVRPIRTTTGRARPPLAHG